MARWRVRIGIGALLAAAFACGDPLPDAPTEPAADASTSEGGSDASASDAANEDAGATEAGGDAATGFCAERGGWLACEDFEQGLPPKRKWQLVENGLSFAVDTTQPYAGAFSGVVAIPMLDAGATPYARLSRDLAAGISGVHVELAAKIARAGSGDVQLAFVVLRATNGDTLSVTVQARTNDTVLTFCHNGGPCDTENVPVAFAVWTPLVIEVPTSGALSVAIAGTAHPKAETAIGAVLNGTVTIGVGFAQEGPPRSVSIDDALVSVK